MRFWQMFVFLAVGLAAFASDRGIGQFPIEFRDGFIWAKVEVQGGGEPLNFIVDSGAGVSTLNVAAAERLKLKGGRRVSVVGIGGTSSGLWPQRMKASVGDVRLPEQYLVTDLCALQESCSCRIDGLIGADFFRGRVVEIDFVRRELRVRKAVDAKEGIPLRFAGRALLVEAEVNGEKAKWMRLDTGCVSDLEWVSARSGRKSQGGKVAVGLSGVQVPTAEVEVKLGEINLKGTAGIHARSIFAGEGGLIGLGLLSRFSVVTIDGINEQLILSGYAKSSGSGD